MLAVGGDAIETRGVIACGTLGAPVPLDEPTDNSEGELALLGRALEHAGHLRTADQPLYVLWHYPPFDRHGRPGPVVSMLEASNVTCCVYGHIHTEGQWTSAVQGAVNGVRYHCVAADAIGFRPLRIG